MTTIEFNTRLTGLQKYLEAFARQLTGNDDDAKDLTQETLLKALVYREKYVNQNNFKAWVYDNAQHFHQQLQEEQEGEDDH